jgi:hypothetical protein
MPNDTTKVCSSTRVVKGYESCLALLPDHDTFPVVLSNATGLVDMSDYLVRILLQELTTPPSIKHVDIVAMVTHNAKNRGLYFAVRTS